jgi:hypothetical protein
MYTVKYYDFFSSHFRKLLLMTKYKPQKGEGEGGNDSRRGYNIF